MTQRVYDQWIECAGCGDVHVVGRCPNGYAPPPPPPDPADFPPSWRLLDDVEILELPDPEYLVAGILPRRSVGAMYGRRARAKQPWTARWRFAWPPGARSSDTR